MLNYKLNELYSIIAQKFITFLVAKKTNTGQTSKVDEPVDIVTAFKQRKPLRKTSTTVSVQSKIIILQLH